MNESGEAMTGAGITSFRLDPAPACPTARFDPSGQAGANDSFADEAAGQLSSSNLITIDLPSRRK